MFAISLVGRVAGTDPAVLKIDDEKIAESLKPAEIIRAFKIKVENIVPAIGRVNV